MLSDNNDRRVLRRNRQLTTSVRLAALVANAIVWWFASNWLTQRFGIDQNTARIACALVLMLIELPFSNRLNNRWNPGLARRQQWLRNERVDRRMTRARLVVSVCLALMLLLQLHTLFRSPHGMDLAARLQLTADAVIVLAAWRADLLQLGGNETVDEARRAAIRRAAQHGFTTLIVCCLAALIYDGVKAGTLAASIPAALITALLATQISLAIHDRQGQQEQDD